MISQGAKYLKFAELVNALKTRPHNLDVVIARKENFLERTECRVEEFTTQEVTALQEFCTQWLANDGTAVGPPVEHPLHLQRTSGTNVSRGLAGDSHSCIGHGLEFRVTW
jgi:hypothetical protein